MPTNAPRPNCLFRRIIAVAFLIAAGQFGPALTGPALADTPNCWDGSPQETLVDASYCAEQMLEINDANLQSTYEAAIEWAGGADSQIGSSLMQAQEAWLIYRDNHCTSLALQYQQAAAPEEARAVGHYMRTSCLANHAQMRDEEIRTYLEQN